jgi:WD40 repeat protein/serine/threonine protein kinase
MKRTACPRRDDLLSFSLGKLPDAASDQIGRHLDDCPDCRSAIEVVGDAGDTVAASLRLTVREDAFAQEPEWQQALVFIDEIGRENAITPSGRPLPATVRDYRLLHEIGQGGMGRVYKAEHVRLKRTVALKLLPESRLKEAHAVARFAREMEAVGRLEHPHIVRAMDAGEHDGLHYLVMELVPGLDLSRLARRHGPLSVADACEIARQAAIGLQHAHEHGLIHRDVKPSNLMLTPTGQVKILDLGLALIGERPEADTTELTGAGQLMGTIDYMAPEQADDSHVVDIRADIYSLGATLYKLLCGAAPFERYKDQTPIRRIGTLLKHAPQPITERRGDIPAELSAVIHRMLAREPQNRYSTPAEVAEALAPWTAGAELPGLIGRFGPPPDAKNETATPSTQDLSRSFLEDTQPPPFPSTKPSAAPVASLSDTHRTQPHGVAARPRRPLLMSVAAALVLSAIAAAGAFAFRIATDRGDLVIESAEPDVEVTIRRNGQPVDDLELKQGRNETTIRSGEYEVVLTGAETDGLHIENNRFTLTRGGEVVVRITRRPGDTPAQGKSHRDVAAQTPAAGGEQLGAWPLGPAEDVLPGLIPRPANLSGIGRWQIETVAPRAYIRAIAWSPDGELIACGTAEGQVRIYDARTLRLVRMLPGAENMITRVAWSPNGEWLAIVAEDKTSRIWHRDGAPGPVLAKGEQIIDLAWSPDGTQLVGKTGRGEIQLFSAEGTPGKVIGAHAGFPGAVAWSPDGKWIATSGDGGPIRLWTPEGNERPVLEGHTNRVIALAWSPDGQQLASGGSDRTVRLWERGGTPASIMEGHSDTVHSVAWSPDGKQLVSAGTGEMRLWDLEAGTGVSISNRGTYAVAVAWSPDGREFAFGGGGANHSLMIASADGEHVRAVEAPNAWPYCIAWSPDHSRLASSHHGGTMRLWTDEGRAVWQVKAHDNPATRVAWSPDGQKLASTGHDFHVRVWTAEGQPGPAMRHEAMHIWSVAWSRDGRWLASAAEKTPAQLWTAEGAPGPGLEAPEFGQQRALAWNPVRDRLATGDFRYVRLWTGEGALVQTIDLKAHGAQSCSHLAWSPDGEKLAVSVEHRTLLFDADGARGSVLDGARGVDYAANWSPDGKRLATASQDWRLRLWSADGKNLAVLPGHRGSVFTADWSHDGRRIASGSKDGVILGWNAETYDPLWVAVPLRDDRSVTFSAAGELRHGDPVAVNREFIYLVEQPDGRLELLTHAEFQERVQPTSTESAAPPPGENPSASSIVPR